VAPVSILKPVRGLDPDAYARLASFCRQQYPEYEVLFGVADADDPAVDLIRLLIRDCADVSIRLVCPIPSAGPNEKVSIVRRLALEAAHDIFVVSDSDVAAPPDLLQQVVAPLAERSVGAVCCLYRGGSTSLLGDLEALGISTEFVPGVLVAERIEGLRFALGAVMAAPRARIEEIGGFDALLDCCADDFELGRRIAALGCEIRLAGCVVSTACEPPDAAAFFRHSLRWAMTERQSRPGGWLAMSIVTQGLPWCVAAAMLSPSWPVGAGYLGAYLLLRLALAWQAGAVLLGDDTVRRRWWLVPARDAVALVVSAAALVATRIEWRGRRFVLRHGRLVPIQQPGAAVAPLARVRE
jgi:ceramide glucosyltransferase